MHGKWDPSENGGPHEIDLLHQSELTVTNFNSLGNIFVESMQSKRGVRENVVIIRVKLHFTFSQKLYLLLIIVTFSLLI